MGLGLEARKCGVEGVGRELRGDGAADTTARGDVGVVADFVRGAGVVDAAGFDKDFDVDLVEVFGNAEEAGGEVFGCMYHAVLTLGSEHWYLSGLGEVIEEMAVELAIFNSQHEVLAATEWCKKFST